MKRKIFYGSAVFLFFVQPLPLLAQDISAEGESQNIVKAQESLIQRNQQLTEKHAKIYENLEQRSEGLIDRKSALIEKEEKNAVRFEKILDKWESQQAQYQSYLDSLPRQKEAR